MTLDELKKDWDDMQTVIKRERQWRRRVFGKKPELLKEKLAEIDGLQAILVRWKELLKSGYIVPSENDFNQPMLIDVPRKDVYK